MKEIIKNIPHLLWFFFFGGGGVDYFSFNLLHHFCIDRLAHRILIFFLTYVDFNQQQYKILTINVMHIYDFNFAKIIHSIPYRRRGMYLFNLYLIYLRTGQFKSSKEDYYTYLFNVVALLAFFDNNNHNWQSVIEHRWQMTQVSATSPAIPLLLNRFEYSTTSSYMCSIHPLYF